MNRRLILATVCVLAVGTQAFAQQPPPQTPRAVTPAADRPAPPPPPPAPAPVAQPAGQAVNVKVDVTITDQRGAEATVKRNVSVIAADGYLGRVRAISSLIGQGEVPLNVDATPTLLKDGKIRLQFTLSYDWSAPYEPSAPGNPLIGKVSRTNLQNSVSLVLENGKPMIAAQSADPVGDRTVSVEVKATILK
jgi:hypothetical protein